MLPGFIIGRPLFSGLLENDIIEGIVLLCVHYRYFVEGYNPMQIVVKNPPTLIQRWTEIIIQLRVLPQILSQVLTNIQNAKKKRNKWHTKNYFFLHYLD